MVKPRSKGRQKIEIQKIEDEEARYVAFSKRRSGVYKKANELATLCGAQVGIIVFSPSGQPYTFGTGDSGINGVAERFVFNNPVPSHNILEVCSKLNKECNDLLDGIEAAETEREVYMRTIKAIAADGRRMRGIYDLDAMSLEEMEVLSNQMKDIKARANARAAEIIIGAEGMPQRCPLRLSSQDIGGTSGHRFSDPGASGSNQPAVLCGSTHQSVPDYGGEHLDAHTRSNTTNAKGNPSTDGDMALGNPLFFFNNN